jgi:hypothetical protein
VPNATGRLPAFDESEAGFFDRKSAIAGSESSAIAPKKLDADSAIHRLRERGLGESDPLLTLMMPTIECFPSIPHAGT